MNSAVDTAVAGAPARRRLRFLRWSLVAFGTLAVLAGAISIAVPHVLQTTLPDWVKDKTGRVLQVGRAAFNPLTLRLTVGELSLKDGTTTLASLDAIEFKGAWSSLVNLAWTADRLSLSKPEINARINKDGSLDWQRLIDALPKSEDTTPSERMPRILLRNVEIKDAAFRLFDERAGATENRLTLAPLSFSLEKLSTLPRDRGDYALEARLNDQTRIRWQGRVGLNPIDSSGDLVVSNLPVARALALANVKVPLTLEGSAAFKATYSVAFGTNMAAVGMGGGSLEVSGLRASRAALGGDDAVSVKSITLAPLSASWAKTRIDGREQQVVTVLPLGASVNGVTALAAAQKEPVVTVDRIATPVPVEVDLAARRFTLPQIRIDAVHASLQRDRTGTLLLPWVSPAGAPTTATPAGVVLAAPNATPSVATPAPPAAPTAPAEAAPWRIELGEVSTEGARVALSDDSFAVPQRAALGLSVAIGASVTLGPATDANLSARKFSVTGLSVRDEGAREPWLTARELRAASFATPLTGARIDLPKFDLLAPAVTLALGENGADIARRFQSAASAATATPARADPTPSPVAVGRKPPTVSIAGIAVSDGRISMTDATLSQPLTHVLQGVEVASGRIALDGSQPVAATLRAALQSGGALQGSVRYDLRQQRGETELMLEGLTLAPFAPYLSRSTRLTLDRGTAALGGKITFVANAPGDDTLRFAGKAAVRDLSVTDVTTRQPFAQWAELSSQDLRLGLGARGARVELADLLLDQPRGDIVIGEDGSLNLTQIGKTVTPAALPAATAGSGGAAPVGAVPPAPATMTPPTTNEPTTSASGGTSVKIDRLQITGGDVHFADLSLRPQFGTRVSDLSGLVVGISSEPSSRAEVSLEGKVDEFGLARLAGTIAPSSAAQYTDLKASFRNLEMRNLTPYSGKFAGRTIESGKLTLELEYKVLDRKLKGENQIIVDNLKLGDRVESKDATNLPLDLAIALLSDSKGVIDLGLPVQGSLDDPQFSMSGLVWKAITNVLAKLVTAPFRALGALLGGSGEEFEAVLFEPGEARLLPPEREKLGKLAGALQKRPQLKLAIEGRYDLERDREALADNILKLEISKRAGMKPPGANEPLVISLTDSKVQTALDELATAAGDEAAQLRAKYFPAAGNALTGLLQGARERMTEKGRTDAAEARAKYYPELFKLLRSKQGVPDIAFGTLATFRAEAIRATLTAVNSFDPARVSVAAAQPVKTSAPDRVAATLALSVK
ncbi:MAG: DUF748 domain-containing protein [Burkholderiales bacterium]|nr:DUF748 domain-containing protein [Burkholderiales bacterium]